MQHGRQPFIRPRVAAMAALHLVLAAAAAALAFPQATRADSASAVLDALVAAYPDALVSHDGTSIRWRDGTVMAASDGMPHKTFEQLLNHASILDQFRLPYPRGELTRPPAVNDDPGRFRNQAFFIKMYGDCRAGEVRRHLAAVQWLPHTWGHTIYITRINGVDRRLRAVSAEIDALPEHIKRAAYPIGGTLSCRTVADTRQLSMHSYGAAIDLNTAVSDYWLWRRSNGHIPYRNRMPQQIVDIFERHGFIWGGKWYHYDTMHFEYRPELLGMRGR